MSSYHGYSGYMQNTSCAAGFRKSVNTVDSMVCHEDADGMSYSTCCLPNDPASVALEFAVLVKLVTHIWAEGAQQFKKKKTDCEESRVRHSRSTVMVHT